MNLNTADIEQLDRYLRNELDAQERKSFEQRLERDPALKEELDHLRMVREAMRREELAEKKKMLERYDDELEDSSGNLFGISWKWSVAATILLIVTAWLIWPREEILGEHERLFAEFMQAPELDASGTRSGLTGLDSTGIARYNFATNNYIIGQYEVAAPALKDAFEGSLDTSLLLYAGIAYLANGNEKEAIDIFNEWPDWPKELAEDRQWFLALTKLKAGRLDELKAELTEMSSGQHKYKDSANALMEKLN